MTAVSKSFFARLAAIAAIAAAWRIWYILDVVRDRIPKLGLSDEFFYHQQAKLLADGHGFTNPFLLTNQGISRPTALHPPLYSMFLAVPAKVGIDTPTQQRIMTALLGVATVVLIGILGRRVAGERAGLIAAALAAISPALWTNDSVLGLETLFCFLVVLALLALYRFWAAPSLGRMALLAVPLALGALTRSEGIMLLVFIGVTTALLAPGWDWRRRFQGIGVLAAISIVVIAPWVVRNLSTFEQPTVLGTGFGLVLNYGNCDATYSGELLGYWSNDCVTERYTPDQEESVYDSDRASEGRAYLTDHVSDLPKVALARAGRIWEAFRPSQNVDLNAFFERRGTQASWAVLVGYYLVLPFAIAGAVVMRRRRLPIYPFVAIVVAVTLTAVLGFPITRYRASFDAVATVLAAVAIDALWRRWRSNRAATDDTSDGMTAQADSPATLSATPA
jgi:4-amino-4-deoxy-L-arabinose transferase-like glycosyltransferase